MSTLSHAKKLVGVVSNSLSAHRNVALALASAATLALGATSVQAASLSNGSLSVDINNGNGAIGRVLFGGSDFYNPGTPVSDYGFQNGTDTSTFNSTWRGGFFGSAVSSSSSAITVSGSYTGGGANISFTRVYSLVPGLNVLRTVSAFTNNGSDTTLSAFDTFDPDQGINQGSGFETFNQVLTLSTPGGVAKAGQATESGGLTVIVGSLDSRATVASGNPFAIFSGDDLNNFFASPFDDGGAFSDSGTHIGLRSLLTAGTSLSFTYDQAFGTSASAAQSAFIAANGDVAAVPTPALLPGLVGLGFGVLRKRKAEAAKQTSEA